jgi:hypothetical protein
VLIHILHNRNYYLNAVNILLDEINFSVYRSLMTSDLCGAEIEVYEFSKIEALTHLHLVNDIKHLCYCGSERCDRAR